MKNQDKTGSVSKRPMDLVPWPSDWTEFGKKYSAGLGLKSVSELYKGTLSVLASRRDELIVFSPMVNVGKGFQNSSESDVSTDINASADEIASALDVALSKCR